MKKFFIGVAAVVTVWALVLAGCPDSSAGGGAANCVAPASGDATIDLVFGDVTYNGCNQLTPTAKVFNSASDSSEVTTIKAISGDGANGSATFFRLSTSNAALTHAGATLVFGADYDTTGKTLQFSVRATDGAANTVIRVFYEAEGGFPDQTAARQVIKTFTTDGTWQDISILFSEFDFGPTDITSGNITPETVRAIGFDLRDFNGATPGIGLQTIDIDEIRFVDPDLSYICTNGTPASGTGTAPDMSNCQECDQGFEIEGTAGDPGSTCVNELRYICTNGTPVSGNGATAGVSNCAECNDRYMIVGVASTEGAICAIPYVCENGTAADPSTTTTTENVSNCAECIDDYDIVGTASTAGSTCVQTAFPYVCTDGTPSDGRAASADTSRCALCDLGFSPSGTLGADGSTCTAISGCEAPASGTTASVSTIYADGDYAGCSAATLVANAPGVDPAASTFAEINGGANSTSKARTLDNTVAGATHTVGFFSRTTDVDVSGKTLRFNVLSPETGGTTSVRVYLEADPGANSAFPDYQTLGTEGIQTFTNDGTWQEISIDLAAAFSGSFAATGTGAASQITAATVRTIGFAMTDVNGATAGIGVQTLSIDEVRIEDSAPNCSAPAMGDASVDLVWGDAVYSSCSDDITSNRLRTAIHVPTHNAQSRPASPFTVTTSSLAGGASSTALFNTLTLGGGNSAWAYAIADLPANYSATGKTLKFSVKSPATGGTNSIGVFLGDASSQTSTSIQTFTNDGTWQEISVSVDSDVSGGPKTAVRRVIFSLVDTNGLSVDGIGAQTLAIDEIRFE